MSGGLNDAFTVGIILMIILGAVFFYFYTRIGQVEKRMKLLETILLDLKVATEGSFIGFSGEDKKDEEPAEEVEVAESEVAEAVEATEEAEAPEEESVDAAEVVADTVAGAVEEAAAPEPEPVHVSDGMAPFLDINSGDKKSDTYDYMSLKELVALAKQRGISGVHKMKRDELVKTLRQKEDDSLNAPVNVFEAATDVTL
jgi:hypothetical protein